MKIKIRPDDTSALQENDWLQTDGWLAGLRGDGPRPAMATPSRRAAAIPGQKFLPSRRPDRGRRPRPG